jgi:hypothetical protein
MKFALAATFLALALAGCGGGSTLQPTVATPLQATAPMSNGTTIQTSITVPGTQAALGDRRAVQYVSASTLGLKITVTDIPPTGKTASFTPIVTTYTLSVGLNLIVVPTPASASGHSEDITYVAYNLAPVANVIPTGAKALGWGLTTGFVVQPGQNANNVVLSGVADGFPAPLAETGSFGMMSAAPPTLAGAQTSLGFGAAAPASGIATLLDAGTNDITTAAGGPWGVVGAVPTTATTPATGVPLTIAETAGTCGAIGTGPHLELSVDGGTPAVTAALQHTNDTLQADYDGKGGAGWYAVVSAKGQTQTLTYTLASLAATSTNTDFSCANQTLSFSEGNETALITIDQHTTATPYTLTVPNTASCNQLVNVYAGNSTAIANKIPYGTPTSLGAVANFTIQLQTLPGGAFQCNIEIQDANATSGATGGSAFPGGTTYVAALLPPAEYSIIVP